MKPKTKFVTLAALAALAASAAAATLASISGSLSPDHYREHSFTVSRGDYVVDLENLNPGDLDCKVFAEDGTWLGEDLLDDNHPIVWFHSDRRQTIKVRVINASERRSADYTGTIEVDD